MRVQNSFNLNKGNAVQDSFIIRKLEIAFWSNFKMPKCGKPKRRNWFTVAFLELQKYLFLNVVGFKMFDCSKYPTNHSFMSTCFTRISQQSLSSQWCWCPLREGPSPLMPYLRGCDGTGAPPQEPEGLGSFPYSTFTCDFGQVTYAPCETSAPS